MGFDQLTGPMFSALSETDFDVLTELAFDLAPRVYLLEAQMRQVLAAMSVIAFGAGNAGSIPPQ